MCTCRYLVRWWCLVARIKVLQQYPKGNSKYFLWEIISSRSIRCSFYVSYLNTMSPLHPGDEQFTELNFLEVACLKTSQICAHCFMEIGNCWKLDVKTLKCLKSQRIQKTVQQICDLLILGESNLEKPQVRKT